MSIKDMIQAATAQMSIDLDAMMASLDKDYGDGVGQAMATVFTSEIIKCLILNRFSRVTDSKNKQVLYRRSYDAFSDIKTDIQGAVAAGFTKAMHEYSGKTVEYYCQVTPMPPAVNKDMI